MLIKKSHPSISVVCPSYNSSGFILRALNSLLAQTKKPLEVIVSDDGSTDATREIVKKFAAEHPELLLRLIENTHRGPGAARNSGIVNANGDWIAFIDSDDSWRHNKLEVVSQAILQYPECNFFCNFEDHSKLDGQSIFSNYSSKYNPNITLPKQLYQNNLFSTSAVTCSKNLLRDVSLFDEKLLSGQDYDLWLKLSYDIKHYYIEDILGTYYERSDNISSKKLLRRWRNLVLIYIRHRKKGGAVDFYYNIARITALMLINSIG